MATSRSGLRSLFGPVAAAAALFGCASSGDPAIAGASGTSAGASSSMLGGMAGSVSVTSGGHVTGGGSGAGGMHDTGDAGSFAAAGTSGSAGAAGNGGASGGTGGVVPDPAADRAAFAVLDHFQVLDPCDLTSYSVEPGAGAVCPQLAGVKNQHISLKAAGDASITYVVSLRVRGLVERYWYEGGQLDAASQVFYTGGVPTIGSYASACKNKASELPFSLPPELTPKDGCFNGFNVFALDVSAPSQHYFLNYTTDRDNDRPPHAVYSQDYTVEVELQGQATLDFYVIGSDEHECYNHSQIIDGVQLSPSPYIGEFLQFDVVSVVRKGA